jgi:hypothetical protein
MSTTRTKRTHKATGRRINTVAQSDERLSIDRRVYLPFDLAIVHGAMQNFRLDLAKGMHHYLDDWLLYKSNYLSEALGYMKDDGCNLYPGHNSEWWIHTERTCGVLRMPTDRSVRLLDLFDMWIDMDDPELLKSDDFPCPTKINSNLAIDKATKAFERRFCYN